MKEMLLQTLAQLIQYPTEESVGRANQCLKILESQAPQSSSLFKPYLDYLKGHSLADLEEEYVKIFDFNQDRALEIGWHLYGETYSRGDFLVKMRGLLYRNGIEETSELPDHLGHVLRVMETMEPEETLDFAGNYVLPALEKLIEATHSKKTPYEDLLLTIQSVLKGYKTQLSGVQCHG